MAELKSTEAQPEPEADLPPTAENGEIDKPVVGDRPMGFFSVRAGAKAIRRSPRWVRIQMERGEISYTMCGREPLLPPDFVAEFLERHLVRAQPLPREARARRGWKDDVK
jgi:hypothetical protein